MPELYMGHEITVISSTLFAMTFAVYIFKQYILINMATVKVKFRPSIVIGKEGTIYYQIIHNRVSRQIKTDYRIFTDEWDKQTSAIKCNNTNNKRSNHLVMLQGKISKDLKRLECIIREAMIRENYTADDLVEKFNNTQTKGSFSYFMKETISQLKRLGKERTAENYAAALNSYMRFRNGNDILLFEINSDIIMEYEAFMKANGITMNTISFYNRILRAVYNRAVEKELVVQCYPFRHVYTGVDKTIKRAVSLNEIRQIKELDLSLKPNLDLARDMFLFSFYTRGMSFIDMAFLRKDNLRNGILSYRRKKTNRLLLIKWEKTMQEIIDKYDTSGTSFLLPIIRKPDNELIQYRNAQRMINNKLKEISLLANLEINLTMYVSRHSWASIAKKHNIPLSVISDGLGHDSESTTQIYLASLDNSMIDKANELILKKL